MLSPKDFVARWQIDDNALVRFPKRKLRGLSMHQDDMEFLVQAGLPKSAAPFLSFDAGLMDELPTVAFDWELGEEFDCYRVIGSDGCGSPIAIDESHEGQIVCLDHDCRFERILVNSSVRQLAESLLAYRKMVKEAQAEFGPDAFLHGKISLASREELRHELLRIDKDALAPGCFWQSELQNLEEKASG